MIMHIGALKVIETKKWLPVLHQQRQVVIMTACSSGCVCVPMGAPSIIIRLLLLIGHTVTETQLW